MAISFSANLIEEQKQQIKEKFTEFQFDSLEKI